MFVPIIKPTLKNANFGPNNFVKPNDIKTNKIIIVKTKRASLFIWIYIINHKQTKKQLKIKVK